MWEPIIWIMMGYLISSKVSAVILIFLIQRKSTEWLFCFSATMVSLKYPVPLIITSTAVTFPISQHPNILSPHISSSTSSSWGLEMESTDWYRNKRWPRRAFLPFICLVLYWSFHTPQRYKTFYNYDHNEMPSGIQEVFPPEHLEKQ